MGKVSIDLDDSVGQGYETVSERAVLAELAVGLPSVGKARLEHFRHAERVIWSFSQVPVVVKKMAEVKAREKGMGLKEFLYHCLRLGGVDIPEYSKMDGRRR